MAHTQNETDELVRYSRRSLWIALVLILLLGAPGAISLGFPDTEVGALFKRFWNVLPIGIILAVIALRSSAPKRVRLDPSGAMQVVLYDELRAASVHRAYRNAFMGVMVLQPVLAVALTQIAMADPLAFATCVTVVTGALILLASILAYDR